jgi:hypothetical protein
MKRCFRTMYLFVPIVIFLLVSTACSTHKYCTRWDSTHRYCTDWACKYPYFKDGNKCIHMNEYCEKYPWMCPSN